MSPNSILIGQVGVVFTTIGAGVWGATQCLTSAPVSHLSLHENENEPKVSLSPDLNLRHRR